MWTGMIWASSGTGRPLSVKEAGSVQSPKHNEEQVIEVNKD